MYLSKAEIAALTGEEKPHFLNPKAKRTQKALSDLAGITGFGFHLMEVQPGPETTELHRHHFEDECVYVLAGKATAYLGAEVIEIEAGDFLGHPKKGAPHMLKNTGDEVLKYIVVGERRDSDVVEYPRLNKRLYRHAGLDSQLCDIEE